MRIAPEDDSESRRCTALPYTASAVEWQAQFVAFAFNAYTEFSSIATTYNPHLGVEELVHWKVVLAFPARPLGNACPRQRYVSVLRLLVEVVLDPREYELSVSKIFLSIFASLLDS